MEVILPLNKHANKFLKLKELATVDPASLIKLVISIGLIELTIMIVLDYFHLPEPYATLADTAIMSLSAYFLGRYFIYQSVLSYFEKQQSTLLATMAEGFVLQDEKLQIHYFNQNALDILALSEEQILGKTSFDPSWRAIKSDGSPFPGEEHPAVQSLKLGKPVKNVIMGVTLHDNSIRWININAVPIFSNENANVATSVICTFSDITNERINQAKLEQANERFQSAAQAVRFGVWDWNLKTGTLIWDPIMYEIYDLDKKDYVGDYDAFEKTLSAESAAYLKEKLDLTFMTKASEFEAEFKINSKTKGIKYIAAKAKCFYDQNGSIERLVGFNWDITKQVEFKNQIEKQQLLLSSQVKMASLGEMAGGIAHEINNPLSIIKGRAAQLFRIIEQEKFEVDKAKKYLEAIDVTSDRIAKIITGLRSFSRNAENDSFEQYSLLTIVNETMSLCQERFKNHGITLENRITEEVKINCRPTQISQVLLNLINNAFDAATNQNEKWVLLEMHLEQEKEVVLKVTDSGPGINPEIVQKIMQPFFTTKGVGKGTGLGLSISKGIIEDHGGKLILNQDSKNTEFRIHLPLTAN